MPEITVLIPTSPTLKNPDVSDIQEVVDSVKHWLPNSRIMITCDGVRKEQSRLYSMYQEYKQNLKSFVGVEIIEFDSHLHQSGMMLEVLPKIETELLLYVEHDTPLVIDEPIDWQFLINTCLCGKANLIRLHHEARILEQHRHLVLAEEPKLVKTVQWSQRPHLARVDYYADLMKEYFQDSCTFIEDKMHGVVISDYEREQGQGWDKHRLYIYKPSKNMKRSYHLNTRGKEPKYSMKF